MQALARDSGQHGGIGEHPRTPGPPAAATLRRYGSGDPIFCGRWPRASNGVQAGGGLETMGDGAWTRPERGLTKKPPQRARSQADPSSFPCAKPDVKQPALFTGKKHETALGQQTRCHRGAG